MWIILTFLVASASADCPDAIKNLLNANLKTNVDNGCGADWQYFSRPSGGWCIKVFPSTLLNQVDAESQCKKEGAVLTSLQNTKEVDFIQMAALAQIPDASGSVWIGTKRTAKCLKIGKTAACTNTTAFYWTDGSATGTDGFVFQAGQPDNSSKDQDCALLLVSNTPTVKAGGTFFAKQMDDVPCKVAEFPADRVARKIRAYACGKKSSF